MSHLFNGYPKFSGVSVVLSGDGVNQIFHIIIMIFFKGLPKDSYDGSESITTSIIEI